MPRLEVKFDLSVERLKNLKEKCKTSKTDFLSTYPTDVVDKWIETQHNHEKLLSEYLEEELAMKIKHLFEKTYNQDVFEMLKKKTVPDEILTQHYQESLSKFKQQLAKCFSKYSPFSEKICEKTKNQLHTLLEADFTCWMGINNFHKSLYDSKFDKIDEFLKQIKFVVTELFGQADLEKLRLMPMPEKWDMSVMMGDYEPKYKYLRKFKKN